MKVKLLKSKIISNLALNDRFYNVKLISTSKSFIFKPGQFITLKITDSIYRCYSIASTPAKLPTWEMLVDIKPGGPGTTYIKNLKCGDFIQTTKPVGILIHETNATNYIFGATGCGIAAIKPIIEEVLGNKPKTNIYLVWGLKYKKDIVWEEIFENWQAKFSNFKYEIVLSRPNKLWKGKKGHIVSIITKAVKRLLFLKSRIYLCGNRNFINNTKHKLFKLNFPNDRIHFEHFY